MGKANKAKNQKKKGLRFNSSDTLYWEDLQELRSNILNTFVTQIATCSELINKYKNIVESNPDLGNKVKGLMLCYEDIAKKIRFNTEKHVTFGYMISTVNNLDYFLNPANDAEYNQLVLDNREMFNKELDTRKGEVDPESDDFYKFINVQSNYISIGLELGSLVQQPLFNIMLDMGATNDVKEQFKELEKVAIEGEKSVMETMSKGFDNGK